MTPTEQLILDQLARTRADVLNITTILVPFLQNEGLWTEKTTKKSEENVEILYAAVRTQMERFLTVLNQEPPPDVS